ncbi:MAG: ankyrin repeat domain-containing protein [Alphaproteobacteria bacterium]
MLKHKRMVTPLPFMLALGLPLLLCPQLAQAEKTAGASVRMAISAAPPPPISAVDDLLTLVERHSEKGAIEKLEQRLKKGADVNAMLDERLGGCSLLSHAIFATNANPNASGYSDIRKQRYDHITLLLQYGANVKQACTGRYQETPLHQAAEKGDVNLIYLLLEHGADVNARDQMGRTPLFYIFTGTPEAANLLLHSGADPETVNQQNSTPLHTAIYFSNPDMVELLLQHGANPLYMPAQNNRTALEDAQKRLTSDPSNYRLAQSISLMEKYQRLRAEWGATHAGGKAIFSPPPPPAKQLLPALNDSGLITAIKTNNLAQAKALLAANPNEVNDVSSDAHMPLHLAVIGHHLELTQLLLDNKANPNLRNGDGETPLILASEQPELTKLLLTHGANPNQVGLYKHTALERSQNPAVIEMLLQHGADINHHSYDGYNPLYGAVSNKNSPVVEFLLQHGAPVNIQTDGGETPLHKAVTDKNKAMVGLLLANGANPNLKNVRGFTAYDLAKAQMDHELLAMLAQKGGMAGDKEKLLREAIEQSHVAFVEQLLNEGVDIKLGYHANKADDTWPNWPLLRQAVHKYPMNSALIKLLIQRGAPVEFIDSNQNTALHLVEDPEIIGLLAERGLDVNSQNDRGETPLHIHAAYGHDKAVNMLLHHKALPNIRNRNNLTPLEMALRGPQDQRPADGPPPNFAVETPKYLSIIQQLLAAGANSQGLLTADFTKAPYYYWRSSDQAEGYKIFYSQAMQLIKTAPSHQ